MKFKDFDKLSIVRNWATFTTKIQIVGTDTVFTEDDYIVNWNYEDFRYVPNQGFIGQFVERLFDGNLHNIPVGVSLENKEINMQLGVTTRLGETTYYDYGNFLVTKVGEIDTEGSFSFESCDYTKKFNIQYNDSITYPCLALDLANNVCNQAGVDLYAPYFYTPYGTSKTYYYIVGKEGLPAGSYAFPVNSTYSFVKYIFIDTETDLKENDVLYVGKYENLPRVVQRVVNDDFTISKSYYVITTSSSKSYSRTELDFKEVDTYYDFTNFDFVIPNNQFTEGQTCRDVMKAIANLAYSWVRIGADNKCYIDFTPKSESSVDTYNSIDTDLYYESTKADLYYGPITRVALGMSQVDGETVYKAWDEESSHDVCELSIMDNPITYTEDLRRIALNGCEKLFGVKYMPLNIQTIGHPWLEGDDLIKLTNVDTLVFYTYPFNRKLTYRGYIESEITSDALSRTEQEYEYNSDLLSTVRKTQFIVDKQNATITSLVSEVSTEREQISQLQQTVDGFEATISDIVHEDVQDELGNYSTTTQMNAAISASASEITTSVSQTYLTKSDASSTYSTKSYVRSQVSQSASEINATIESNDTKAHIIAKINDSTSSVQIDADVIDLSANDVLNLMSGNTINLTSKNIAINSTNFSVSTSGVLKATNGEFSGKITSTSGTIGGWTIGNDYLYADRTVGGYDYRTYMQPILSSYGEDTWVYSIQRRAAGSSGNYTSLFRVEGNGSVYGFGNHNLIYCHGADYVKSIDIQSSGNGYYFEFLTLPYDGSTAWGVSAWMSDKRLKKDINDSNYNALETLMKIKHREFKYKTKDNYVPIGYVADELEDIDKNLIFEVGKDKMKQPNEAVIIPILSKAIQEQQSEIEDLKNTINELKVNLGMEI